MCPNLGHISVCKTGKFDKNKGFQYNNGVIFERM